jgi:hypothetical protein
MLEGVLGCEWKVLEVRHVGRGRDSKGAGESMEPADMVSKSGVHGSRYGFVVFMKVTRQCKSTATVEHKMERTISWDVHPDSIIVEGVLVRIEALQRMLISRIIAIHRGIVLVAEDNP